MTHPVEVRLARWLLMAHDRADGDELALTNDYMAVMLAVRRPSVTTALHVLEGNRLIRGTRGGGNDQGSSCPGGVRGRLLWQA